MPDNWYEKYRIQEVRKISHSGETSHLGEKSSLLGVVCMGTFQVEVFTSYKQT